MGLARWFGAHQDSVGTRSSPVPLGTVLPLAALAGVLLSTRVLFQPFVWRNWPLDEILLGWLDALRDAVLIACLIALAISLVMSLPVRRTALRALLLGLGIVGGAGLAHLLLEALAGVGPTASLALVPPVLRWSLLAGSVAGIYYTWQRARQADAAVAAAELRRVQIEHEVAQAHLQALRGQIEPHFLFNTLATLRRLQHTEPAEGARLLRHFLAYLGLSLPTGHGDQGLLGQELALVRAYLAVVAVRMSGRLQVQWQVPAELLGAHFPPLIVATLVENAIKHGLAPLPGSGSLTIQAARHGDVLEVEVADTGLGFSGHGGTGIGLANIRARLRTGHGAAAGLRLQANTPRGLRAVVHLPFQEGSPQP